MNVRRTGATTCGGLRRVAAVVIVGSLAIAACGGDDDDGAEDTAASSDDGATGDSDVAPSDDGATGDSGESGSEEPFVVGALYSTGGPLKAYSDAFQQGLDFFISEHPDILGRTMELTIVDDGAEPSAAIAGLELLLDREDADLIVGPYLNSTTVAVLGPLNEDGMINFNQSASADAADAAQAPYSFLVEWPKDVEGQAQLLWACDNGVSTIATIVVNNAGGTDTELSISENVDDAACDIEYLGSQQFATGAPDALAQAEAASDADMIVLGAASPGDFATVVSSLQEIGYEGWIVSNYALGVDSTIDLLPADALPQLVPFGATPRITRPLDADVQAWLDGITEFLGQPPAANAYKSHDALLLYHTAAEAVGSFDADAIREYLETNEVCGAYGCYTYGADSHAPFAAEYNTPYAPGSQESGFVDPWSAP